MTRLPSVSPLPSMAAALALSLVPAAGWFGLWAKTAPRVQPAYLAAYVESGVRASADRVFRHRETVVIYRLAVMPCGHAECLATDEALRAGRAVVREVPAVRSALHRILAERVYGSRPLTDLLAAPIQASIATALALVLVAWYRHAKIWRELRSEKGRLVAGRRLLSEREINRLVKGDGVAIWTEKG